MATSNNTKQPNPPIPGPTSIPIHQLLRHLALKPAHGQAFFPSSWTTLKISNRTPIEIDLAAAETAIIAYQLQHEAHIVYDSASKKWQIKGKGSKVELQTLGVVVSKLHGARAIQLPNKTHKIVAGIVDINETLSLLGAPALAGQNPNKITIPLNEKAEVKFIGIVPAQIRTRSASSGAKVVKSSEEKAADHFQYVLRSKKIYKDDKPQTVQRSKLTWSDQHNTDIVDLSRFKDYLLSLKGTYENDPEITRLPGNSKLHYEQRLQLLEKEIDGLMKKKINYTSIDNQGSRFLDYTTILHEKENQINALNRQIVNLENNLKAGHQKQDLLKKEIERLSDALQTLENPAVTQEQITDLLILNSQTVWMNNQTKNLRKKLQKTSKLLHSHIDDLKLKGVKIENEAQLKNLPTDETLNIIIQDGITHIIETKDKIIEKPIQDEKTHELIRQLGNQIYRIYSKYPQVREQANPQFIELLNKQVLKTVDNDGLSKIVQIVKFVPSLVKVQNFYTYNAEKQRKTEFHLRVLLRSLLQQFEKIKKKTGASPEIDQSVVSMINEQIKDVVNVEDILKCFQVNHKIVEVPKIVEKIVQRVVQVPVVVPIQKIVQKLVTNTQIEQIEKIVHVPIQVIKYIDRIVQKIVEVQKIREKIVEVPKIVEKIIERRVQVPKIVEVQVIRQKIVEVDKPVICQKIVNHAVPEIRQIQVVKQQTVVVKEVIQKIKEVEKCVEKIVEKIVEKPVIFQVEKIVEKIVNTIEYRPAKETVNHIQYVPQIVEKIVQKFVPIIQTVQKIKEVPKIIQKLVEVRVQVPVIKEVKCIEEKIVYQDRIKEVQRIVEKIVPLCTEVEKIVEKRVEVPIIQQRIVTVNEIVQKIVPERYECSKIVQVQKIVQKCVEVQKMIQVPKTVVKYITQEIPVKVLVEKIVEIPKIVERIKQVRVHVDKIIEKMVQVPKVVQVQKIVEKIVVVPRIIQKIVEVPQIIEKVVDRIVQVQKIVQIIKEVKIPITQQRVIEIQVIKHVPIKEIQKVELIREKIVPVIEVQEKLKPVEFIKEKVVDTRHEVGKQIYVDKIVSNRVQVQKIVEVEKAIVIPFEVPVPCEKIVQKLILVQKEVEKIKEVPKETEKIVELLKEVPTVQEIVRLEQKPVIHEKIKQVQKIVPHISQKIVEVQKIREKPVVQHSINEKIVQIPVYHEKIISVINEVPKIYQVQKIVEKAVEVPKFVEITAKEPVFITCNKVVDKFIDKIVHTNTVEQKVVEVPTVKQKLVKERQIIKQIQEVPVNKNVIVEKDKLITKCDVNNKIQTKFEQVHTMEDKIVPICHSSDRIVEVPHLMEKVVEKIILMPQVHQVTRHIVDIQEQASPGVAVDVEFATHEAQYKKLYGDLKKDMDSLILELRVMQKSHPELSEKLKSVEAYMSNLDQVIAHPKIIQVNKEKFVTKEVPTPVLMSKRGTKDHSSEAFYLVLIEKLHRELLKSQSKSNYKIEDQDLKQLFVTSQSRQKQKEIKAKVAQYKSSPEGALLLKKADHQLLTTVLYDKYLYASELQKSNQDILRFRKIAEQRLELLHQFKQTNDVLHNRILHLEQKLRQLLKEIGYNKEQQSQIKKLLKEIEELDELIYHDIKKSKISAPVLHASKDHGPNVSIQLLQTKNRQLQSQVQLLRSELVGRQGKRENFNLISDKERVINHLQKQISQLVAQKGQTQQNLPNYTSVIDPKTISLHKPRTDQKLILKKSKNLQQTNKDPLGIGFKNGFYGQIILPIPKMSVINSYYATPSSTPVLLQNMLANSSTFYPNPANTIDATKRKVFENGAPFCIKKDTPFQRTANEYTDAELINAGIDTNYSYGNLNGYITLPTGDLTFMSATSINEYPVSCPYKSYTGDKDDFNVPLFVNFSSIPSATLQYSPTSCEPNSISLLGHLVVPIYKPGFETAQYYSVGSTGNVILPSAGVPDLKNQVVYVPKGTNYTIYDKNTEKNNFTGYLILPVGNADYLGLSYPVTDVDFQRLSTTPFYFQDENGNKAVPKSSDDLKDYLISRSSSSKPYWWNISTRIIVNKYLGGYIYTPDPVNSAYNQIDYPVAKYKANIIGVRSREDSSYVVNDNNNLRYGRNDQEIHEDQKDSKNDDKSVYPYGNTWLPHAQQPVKKKNTTGKETDKAWNPSPTGDAPWNPYTLSPTGDAPWNPYTVPVVGESPWNPQIVSLGESPWNPQITSLGESPWNPYALPPAGDAPWNPYTLPVVGESPWNPQLFPPGNAVTKQQGKKSADSTWNPYNPPQGKSEVEKFEVKKSGDSTWNPFTLPPGENPQKQQVKKPINSSKNPSTFPPKGSAVQKQQVKKPGDLPRNVSIIPSRGTTVEKQEVKKIAEPSKNVSTFPPKGSTVQKQQVKKVAETAKNPSTFPQKGTSTVQKQQVKKLNDSIWNPYTVPPGGDKIWNPYIVPAGGNQAVKYGVLKPTDSIWNPYTIPPGGNEIEKNQSKKPNGINTQKYSVPIRQPPKQAQSKPIQVGQHWLPSRTQVTIQTPFKPSQVSPRHYKIIQQQVFDSGNNKSLTPPKQSLIHITYKNPPNTLNLPYGSIVGQLESSQVRPVISGSNISLPFNQTLVPYPTENPLYPVNILNLPGRIQKTTHKDENGNIVETIKQVGTFVTPNQQGGNYQSNYLYKSQIKQEGEGVHKVHKQITQIRTNQTVSWISRSRVLDNDTKRQQSPKREQSPPKGEQPPKK